MDPKTTDPVIIDLIKWLKENLPDEVDEEAIFRKVRRVQKVFDTLISLTFEEFYNHALNQHRARQPEDQAEAIRKDDDNQRRVSPEPNVDGDEDEEIDSQSIDNNERTSNCSTSSPKHQPQEATKKVSTLEDMVSSRLDEIKEYLILNEEKQLKTKRLAASTAKLDLKKEQYNLITSIRLDDCRDLISRYNRLLSKK